MQDVSVFSIRPRCKKCGKEMFLSTHIVPIPNAPKEVECYRCNCGNAIFSDSQLNGLNDKKSATK